MTARSHTRTRAAARRRVASNRIAVSRRRGQPWRTINNIWLRPDGHVATWEEIPRVARLRILAGRPERKVDE